MHYRYGGSTAKRTLKCHAWHELSKNAPKMPSSESAILGSALHSVLEAVTRDQSADPYDFVGKRIGRVRITKKHIDEKIMPALECIENLIEDYDIEHFWCELLGVVSEDIGGTADFVGVSRDGKTIIFADFKSGDGILVFAADNEQLLFYAMVLIESPVLAPYLADVEKFVFAIIQPTERKRETLDVWETDLIPLMDFTEEHERAYTLSEKGGNKPVAGDHCRFCPVEFDCPAQKEILQEVTKIKLTDLQKKDLAQTFSMVSVLENHIRAVKSTIHQTLENHTEIDGLKLVNKRGTNIWNDEKNAKKLLIESFGAESLKLPSPAQVRELCKEKNIDFALFSDYISKVSSGTTVALESDARPGVESIQNFLAAKFK